jgi:basic membrane protein A
MKKSIAVIMISVAIILSSINGMSLECKENKNIRVINFLNGAQGDDSFFDSAVRGVSRAQQELGVEVDTIEAGYDPALWQPALEKAAAREDYDILIVGTEQMKGLLQEVAPKYPDKKFIIYDASVNYTECDCRNVYSVLYAQNEGSYLAGIYAGLMTKSGIIGAIGGRDTSVINDFIAGYKQGAKAARPDIEVLVAYADGWNDPSKGEALALDMYRQGADVIFQVAGATGIGIFKAAQESNRHAIGVDSDQALIIEHTDPELAKVILTSVMKNVDQSLYRALKLYLEGRLAFGQAERLGIKEGGVALARNKYYENATPADIRVKVDQAEDDVRNGIIKVDTAFK